MSRRRTVDGSVRFSFSTPSLSISVVMSAKFSPAFIAGNDSDALEHMAAEIGLELAAQVIQSLQGGFAGERVVVVAEADRAFGLPVDGFCFCELLLAARRLMAL